MLTKSLDFVRALRASSLPHLLHYMGSSRHAPSLMADSFEHGSPTIIDGEGNVWVWVGEDADPRQVAEVLTRGAVRYNGQSCTSVNGAIIHPAIYSALRERLIESWKAQPSGDPTARDVHIGPLQDSAQCEWCQKRIRECEGQIWCGGEIEGNLLQPALVENPSPDSELVTSGLFGPALWIRAGTAEDFIGLWSRNRFELCAAILSPSATSSWWLRHLPRAARVVFNGDPSVEHIFEPWGGYPASSANTVSVWAEKYQRVVAVDAPSDAA